MDNTQRMARTLTYTCLMTAAVALGVGALVSIWGGPGLATTVGVVALGWVAAFVLTFRRTSRER
ncbi:MULTISPECIES: hypothetical protein [unclassified Streptomyces]|uniref:hypothetical protein n=1 Tax=unclassified Streptomyces TaxID=2593676 RepID=UPI0033DE3D7B